MEDKENYRKVSWDHRMKQGEACRGEGVINVGTVSDCDEKTLPQGLQCVLEGINERMSELIRRVYRIEVFLGLGDKSWRDE